MIAAAVGDMMHDKRLYKRFKLNDLEVSGKMVLATEVKVIDISISGISLKTNRRLNIGCDYTLKLDGNMSISLRGNVVWCRLIESRKGPKGEMIPIYSAGMQFKDISNRITTELQYLIDNHKIEEVHVIGSSTRLNIRFYIKDQKKAMLIYPDDYKVKTISLGGMRIECSQHIEIESRIPMEMFMHDDNTLKFMGRVASSQVIDNKDQQYNIGIEFLDLREKDREVLASFIAHSSITETDTESAPETTAIKSDGGVFSVMPQEIHQK